MEDRVEVTSLRTDSIKDGADRIGNASSDHQPHAGDTDALKQNGIEEDDSPSDSDIENHRNDFNRLLSHHRGV